MANHTVTTTDMAKWAFADGLNYIEDNQLATLTNYAQFLEMPPPIGKCKSMKTPPGVVYTG